MPPKINQKDRRNSKFVAGDRVWHKRGFYANVVDGIAYGPRRYILLKLDNGVEYTGKEEHIFNVCDPGEYTLYMDAITQEI